MITKASNRKIVDNSPELIEFTITINSIDEWKFMRWLDIMNSYDEMRKSDNNFHSLIKEMRDDYDKDFKESDY